MHGQSGFSDIRVNKGYISEIIPVLLDLIGTATWQSTTFRPFWGPWGRDFWMKMSTKDNVNTVFPFQHQASSSNLHRHKKKTKHNLTKHWQAPKKTKKTQISSLWGSRVLSRRWDCVFFVFFGACQCFVRLCLVFFCACQCFERSKPPNIGRHQKKTRCTKPWQAPKKQETKSQHLLRILDLHRLEICVFCYFWCLPMFCEIMLCFFCFFCACQCFSSIIAKQGAKMCGSPRFQSHQMQKTSVVTVFCAHFHWKNHLPMIPRSKNVGVLYTIPKS